MVDNWASFGDCSLSGNAYRCSSDNTKVEHYIPKCADCTGCYEYMDSFDACGSGEACYVSGSSAFCGTLAYINSFTVERYNGVNYITWDSITERRNLGFNVYEVNKSGENLRKVNEKLIPGLALSPAGEMYRVVDNKGGVNADYKLEWIDYNGRVDSRGPVAAIRGAPKDFHKKVDFKKVTADNLLKKNKINDYLKAHPYFKYLQKMNSKKVPASRITETNLGLRIKIKDTGIYRLYIKDIADTGVTLTGLTAGDISVTNLGEAVPFRLSTDAELTESDYIEFYAVESASSHTATSAYFIEATKDANKSLGLAAAAPVEGTDYAKNYLASVRFEQNEIYALTPQIDDFFYWQYISRQNPEGTFSLNVTGIAEDLETFTFKADIEGVYGLDVEPDHHCEVYLNDKLVKDVKFDGLALFTLEEELPAEFLKEGENIVKIKMIADTGAEYDLIAVDGFTITYNRKFIATDDSLEFAFGENANVAISGFSNENIIIYDITDSKNPLALSDTVIEKSGESYTVSFNKAATGEKKYLAVAENSVNTPFEIATRYPSDIKSAENEADLIIIAYDAFIPALEPLVELRQGQGVKVKVVSTSEIYDEFNFGNLSDKAIKDFIIFAKENWKSSSLESVLLVGDSTNDTKDYLNLGLVNYVPSHYVDSDLWGGTSSDNWFTDLDDAGDFELSIGRLAATTPEEAETMVKKITAYEAATEKPANGSERIILIADKSKETVNEHFEEIIVNIGDIIPKEYEIVEIFVRDFDSIDKAHDKIMEELNKGSLMVVFIGHGSGLSWGAEPVFSTDDLQNLAEGVHQPLAISLSCVNGFFTYPGLDLMGEALIKPENKGAIATWMPADMGLANIHEELITGFVKNLFKKDSGTVGVSLKAALNEVLKMDINDSDYPATIASNFVYMGDPSMKFHTPYYFTEDVDDDDVAADDDDVAADDDDNVAADDDDKDDDDTVKDDDDAVTDDDDAVTDDDDDDDDSGCGCHIR